ncbi:hypothetical protein ACP275_06G069100 [Erythranthe tilingii]
MPTPVYAARQCLTQEAATVLDEAVAVARRRGHAQTTSLHMVSSLLSLPNSTLREACTRTRNSAYSTRVQFKALELSLSVSLDRIPSSQANRVDEPPVANSLMAAIKRSQANQRRQPENFTFYQQQQQQQQQNSSSSSVPIVKVELQNLVLSILDDPLVSRVFGEAGFRSCDIKMATLMPGKSFHPSRFLGCTSRYKRPSPPVFLCNLTNNDSLIGGKGFSFPFMGCFAGDNEGSRRIGEVMTRAKKRCPLLLGVSAADALRNFLESVRAKTRFVLPEGLNGLAVVCFKDEILMYLSGDSDEGPLKSRFREVGEMLENRTGPGIVVSFGDLSAFSDAGAGDDRLRFLVRNLAKLTEDCGGKVWLIGAAAAYEVYAKILNKFPTIEKDWDLEILPVTSLQFSAGGSFPRSSLMESFVPFGGFFSMPPEMKSPLNNPSQCGARCHVCNEKYEQEVAALSNGGLCSSLSQQHQSILPSWLQNAEPISQSVKGKDDKMLLNAKITALQKKWDGICQQLHFKRTLSNGNQFPHITGFQVSENGKEQSSNEHVNKNVSYSSLSTDLQHSSLLNGLFSKPTETPSVHRAAPAGIKSPTSITSVTTDQSSPFSSSHRENQMNVKDPKLLYKALFGIVGRQEEAISAVVEEMSQCRANERNTWINFRGPDRFGKRKIGLALAEILYRSEESLVYVDLSFQDEMTTTHADNLFNSKLSNKYELTMRGTVLDYLVEKLSKRACVVFLENIDKADLVVQNSLSQAVKTGRFTGFCGREVKVSNCVFLGTTKSNSDDSSAKYTEEDVLSAKANSIRILIRFDLNEDPIIESDGLFFMNKRKLFRENTDQTKRSYRTSKSYLDLNLPAEEGSELLCAGEYSDSDSSSDNNAARSSSWLEDYEAQIDRTVNFKPLDLDKLSENIYEGVSECLKNAVGFECSLEIERDIMQQILLAACLYGDKKVEGWIKNVVSEGFAEAVGKYSIDARSVVKLVSYEGFGPMEKFDGLLLPERIVLK